MKSISIPGFLILLEVLQPVAVVNAIGGDASPLWMDRAWKRHAVDDSSRGADGVRLADVNSDGLPDITTGWEEGGVTKVYLHPGYGAAREPWPAVTVGKPPNVEDAVFCDLDGDGVTDVVSSCEGETKCVFVHRAPDANRYLADEAWESAPIPATRGLTRWMFCLPMQVDGRNGVDLVLGSKDPDAVVGWLESPANPRDLDGWTFHPLYRAGWIMSLAGHDVDGDGDVDLVISDRKGANSGVLWLENPGAGLAREHWNEHRIGASGREVMFLHVADLDGDGREEIAVAAKTDEILVFRSPVDPRESWESRTIKVGFSKGVGRAKAVRVGDIDRDGRPDLVYTCEGAEPPRRGVVWLRQGSSADEWTVHDVGGPEGIKFDRIELLDLDGDNDLDILTCEERHNGVGLGVIWYENPVNVP